MVEVIEGLFVFGMLAGFVYVLVGVVMFFYESALTIRSWRRRP